MDEKKLTYCKFCDKDTQWYGTYPAIHCKVCGSLKEYNDGK